MQLKSLTVDAPQGQLEAVLHESDEFYKDIIGVVFHPHPLHEGTMHNKVVTTAARALNKLNIKTIRFNYRGVGASSGSYGNIDGEVIDGEAVIDYCLRTFPNTKLILIGFSFGSYIAAKLSEKYVQQTIGLVIIAPPITNMPFYELHNMVRNPLVIQGDADEVVDLNSVTKWYESIKLPSKDIKIVLEATHFFHGKLIELQDIIISYAKLYIAR